MSERIYLLPERSRYYKANLHSHTTYSDGRLTPEELKVAYQKEGYSILAVTDHNRYHWHRELTDENFVVLAAFETDINEFYKVHGDFSRVKTYHINFYDAKPEQFQIEKETNILPARRYGDMPYLNGYIQKMKEYGFFACYNHPYWSLQNYEDYKDLRGLWAMEIYNHGCEHDGLYGYHPQSYDEMLRLGNRLFCVAGDDNHNEYPFNDPLSDSFGGFVMIGAEQLTYKSVVKALLKGDFYSSMGPTLESLYIENGYLYVKCSPVEKIYVKTEGRNCHKKLAMPGETITEAVFELNGNETYIRVDCQDKMGKHACSNAYSLSGVMPRTLDFGKGHS